MANTKFAIGDGCWRATWTSRQYPVTCPDCLGSGRLRVIMGDESVVSIECAGCQRGYDAPTGTVLIYERKPRAEAGTVRGMEITGEKIEYIVNDGWRVLEADLFDNEQAALALATIRATEEDKRELDNIQQKEKPTHTWSWNAHYHRREIKDAERRLTYHRSKLEVAARKVRERAS